MFLKFCRGPITAGIEYASSPHDSRSQSPSSFDTEQKLIKNAAFSFLRDAAEGSPLYHMDPSFAGSEISASYPGTGTCHGPYIYLY